ncbi:MAG: alkene reductase [Oligoflexia bacterium]|nr:alkene reductase [Oligoflexia bacterium]
MTTLFDSFKVGDLVLKNRLVMAPLTRMRSTQPGNVPNKLNAEYYAQRAGAGLIVAEATQISQQGQGYPGTPGIHSPEQVAGWKLVTEAVHRAGGVIFLQLWHVGRISHSSHQPGRQAPVAPSAIRPSGKAFTADWQMADFETPRALELKEISSLLADYVTAAKNAKLAGFDGVEIHGANGYLLDQFLQTGSNQRTDKYGGSIENRTRLLLEVVDAATAIWGKARVGVRLSPHGTFNDMSDSDPVALFSYVLGELGKRGVGYVHLIEPRSSNAGAGDGNIEGAPDNSKIFRGIFKGTLISAGGYTPETAKQAVASGAADAVAFGRLFISNPDLPRRIQSGAELNRYDRNTFYGGDAKGYTDYPALG